MRKQSYPALWAVGRVFSLLIDPGVPRFKKLLFLLPVIAYWVAPDFLPFIPLDDLLFTLLSGWLFLKYAGDQSSRGFTNYRRDSVKFKGSFIDTEGYTVKKEK